MKAWKIAGLTAALVVAAGVGAAVGPELHGQTAVVRQAPAPAPMARAQVLAGRGSEIGIAIRDLAEADAKSGKAGSQGVVVEDVTSDSPAEKAGLKKGDTVVEFDGERVRSVRQFTRLVQETPAGRTVPMAVLRDGQRVTLNVAPRDASPFRALRDMQIDLGGIEEFARRFGDEFRWEGRSAPPAPPAPPALKGAPPVAPTPPVPPVPPDVQTFILRGGNTLGLSVGDLSPQLASYFGTKDGVLVTSVYDDSAAAKAGVKAGDVITSFNGQNVTSPSDIRRRIQRLEPGAEFTIDLVRDKKPMTVKGKAEAQRPRRTYTYTRTGRTSS